MTEAAQHAKREAILEALRLGNTRRAAASLAGVHSATLYRWMQDDATFCSAVEKAESDAEHVFVSAIRTAAADPKHWTAAAWWLERRKHEDWRKRDVAAVLHAVQAEEDDTFDLDQLDPDELAELDRLNAKARRPARAGHKAGPSA